MMCECTGIHSGACVCKWLCAHMYVHTHICVCAHVCACMPVCTHVHILIYTHVHACVDCSISLPHSAQGTLAVTLASSFFPSIKWKIPWPLPPCHGPAAHHRGMPHLPPSSAYKVIHHLPENVCLLIILSYTFDLCEYHKGLPILSPSFGASYSSLSTRTDTIPQIFPLDALWVTRSIYHRSSWAFRGPQHRSTHGCTCWFCVCSHCGHEKQCCS